MSTSAPRAVIAHGDYREWFADYPREEAADASLVFFGLIRPYKGVERLIEQFALVPSSGASLRVVGKPRTTELAATITRLADADPRVGIRLDYVDDAALVSEITRAGTVVLPYAAMHNSGVLLLALSLERPVLVPRNPITLALGDEVGAGWVTTFAGELTSADLEAAMASSAAVRGGVPDLSAREWPGLALQHEEAFRRAAGLARARRQYVRRR